MGCKRVKFSSRGETVPMSPTAVNSAPTTTSVRSTGRNIGDVFLGDLDASHHAIASAATTPSHSYHVQLERKKYAGENTASQADPCACPNGNRNAIADPQATPPAA